MDTLSVIFVFPIERQIAAEELYMARAGNDKAVK
jgi:hypothetical protein